MFPALSRPSPRLKSPSAPLRRRRFECGYWKTWRQTPGSLDTRTIRAGSSPTSSTGTTAKKRASWWEFFRLRDADEEDLLGELKALAGLQHIEVVGPFLGKNGKPTGSLIHRYRFPQQDVEISEGSKLLTQEGQAFGELMMLDRVGLTVMSSVGERLVTHIQLQPLLTKWWARRPFRTPS